VREELLLQRQDQIVAAIERIILHRAPVHAEQTGQRCSAKPMTVQPPLAPRRKQPVNHEDAQHFLPIGGFAAHRQPCAKKIVQVQRAPEVIAEPARAPLPRMLQAQFTQAHLQGVHLARRGVRSAGNKASGRASPSRSSITAIVRSQLVR